MKLTVNGEPFEVAQAESVAALLEELKIGGRAVAVILNGDMVPANAREACRISEGDHVLLFRFVAGG